MNYLCQKPLLFIFQIKTYEEILMTFREDNRMYLESFTRKTTSNKDHLYKSVYL